LPAFGRSANLPTNRSVVYRAEQDRCRRLPGPASGQLRGGPRRNFQVFTPPDFLAEVTQYIPEKGDAWGNVESSTGAGGIDCSTLKRSRCNMIRPKVDEASGGTTCTSRGIPYMTGEPH
jgi:hypothetical protein